MPQDFHEQLTEFLPKMRIWALALTRNRAAAEDLTQDVATKALMAKDCFIPGTNFSAWVHRIMINHFISSVRNKREFTDMDTMPELPVPAAHEDRTALRELGWALNRLPAGPAGGAVHDRAAGEVLQVGCRGDRLRDRHVEKPGAPGATATAHAI